MLIIKKRSDLTNLDKKTQTLARITMEKLKKKGLSKEKLKEAERFYAQDYSRLNPKL